MSQLTAQALIAMAMKNPLNERLLDTLVGLEE